MTLLLTILWSVAIGGLVLLAYFKFFSAEKSKKEIQSANSTTSKQSTTNATNSSNENQVKILYGSQTGTAKEWAEKLAKDIKQHGYEVVGVQDIAKYDPDELTFESILLFVVSTYTDGTPPENCIPFFNYLEDLSTDFRMEKSSYQKIRYGVFGIGHSIYGNNFNKCAKSLDSMMLALSCERLLQVGLGDNGAGTEVAPAYNFWTRRLWNVLQNLTKPLKPMPKSTTSSTTTTVVSPATNNSTSQVGEKKARTVLPKTSEEPEDDPGEEETEGEPLVDVEDLGAQLKPQKKPTTTKRQNKNNNNNNNGKQEVGTKNEQPQQHITPANDSDMDEDEDETSAEEDDDDDMTVVPGAPPKEMLTDSLRKALTKQGYKLLGSHSGVKMCRWTKAMLRGRGGCYKHTFYGIQSYQCMEMTPSLACANKCVFCWRHHKNPVGTDWRWKVDEPEDLINQATKNHQQLIRQLKGVPGVVPERFEEAQTIRHCALSLVGEPIIYPHINKFIDMLHDRNISSFMVTNAQFPDKIDELKPVTQLYISVDASTKESLKKIDRPIFTDFWERFLACIESLGKKGQRTVFRLTLVKQWNMEEMKQYAELIERGSPSFVEIKGVTYCGTSKASSLTMQNVPFHDEVIMFTKRILEATPYMKENYELVCEHEHSCCLLLAHKRFFVNGKWRTWIDYDRFLGLVKSGKEFTDVDYIAETPSWALYGSKERGFDPEETKFKRNKPYQKGGC